MVLTRGDTTALFTDRLNNDTVRLSDVIGKVTFYGGKGEDIITLGRYNVIDGGTGNDAIFDSGHSVKNTIMLGKKVDTIHCTISVQKQILPFSSQEIND